MKKSIFTCLVVLVFSTVAFGDFAILTVEELVKKNNLIVTARLKDVIKTENDEFKISNGILVIEKVNYGNFLTFNNQKLKAGDKVPVEWRNSKMMSCRFEFTENENQIWYLNVDEEGKIELLTNNSSSRGGISEFELSEIKKQTQKKGEAKF